MSDQYYHYHSLENIVRGPYDFRTLCEKIKSGEIANTDSVCLEGFEWETSKSWFDNLDHSNLYYIYKTADEETQGPFTYKQVEESVQKRLFSAQDFICDGSNDWIGIQAWCDQNHLKWPKGRTTVLAYNASVKQSESKSKRRQEEIEHRKKLQESKEKKSITSNKTLLWLSLGIIIMIFSVGIYLVLKH